MKVSVFSKVADAAHPSADLVTRVVRRAKADRGDRPGTKNLSGVADWSGPPLSARKETTFNADTMLRNFFKPLRRKTERNGGRNKRSRRKRVTNIPLRPNAVVTPEQVRGIRSAQAGRQSLLDTQLRNEVVDENSDGARQRARDEQTLIIAGATFFVGLVVYMRS